MRSTANKREMRTEEPPRRRLRVRLAPLVVGKAADSVSTYVALSFGPPTLVEANPLSLALQNALGLLPALCVVFTAAVVGITLVTETVLAVFDGVAENAGVSLPLRSLRLATFTTAGGLYAAVGLRNTFLLLTA